jgi:hypothetical protein
MEKQIVVKVAGAGEPKEATIHPGTTAGDLLDGLGLSRSLLLTQDPAGVPFASNEVLWDKVGNGAKVFACPAMEVGKDYILT